MAGFAITGTEFHTGRAVEDKNDGIDRSASAAEKATREWARDCKNQCRNREGPAGKNEDVFELFLSSGFTGCL